MTTTATNEKRLSNTGIEASATSALQDDAFKQKSTHSKQKLENFFGQRLPIDVSIQEIETYGMKALLQSSVPLCYFLYVLLENHCAENLFFYMEVEQFESLEFGTKEMMISIAMGLYDTFIRDDSEFEVNIDTKIRRPILREINDGNQKCFTTAKEHVLNLLEPVFQKFKGSYIYEKMKKEIGNTSVYDKVARNAGVRILLRSRDKTLPEASKDKSTSVTQQRNDMIRVMLHAFCETRLGIHFVDRNRRIEVKSAKEETARKKSSLKEPRVTKDQNSSQHNALDLNGEGIDSFEAYLSKM